MKFQNVSETIAELEASVNDLKTKILESDAVREDVTNELRKWRKTVGHALATEDPVRAATEISELRARVLESMKRPTTVSALPLSAVAVARAPQEKVVVTSSDMYQKSLSKLQSQLAQTSSELDAVKKTNVDMEKKIAELTDRVASGEFNPNTTKVLRLKRDTSSARDAAAHAGVVDSGATAKRAERLKELFRTKTQEFKEAVYLLTGYKLDMSTADEKPRIRARSMFAEREDDFFLFQWERESNSLELLETDLCSRLSGGLVCVFEALRLCARVFG